MIPAPHRCRRPGVMAVPVSPTARTATRRTRTCFRQTHHRISLDTRAPTLNSPPPASLPCDARAPPRLRRWCREWLWRTTCARTPRRCRAWWCSLTRGSLQPTRRRWSGSSDWGPGFSAGNKGRGKGREAKRQGPRRTATVTEQPAACALSDEGVWQPGCPGKGMGCRGRGRGAKRQGPSIRAGGRSAPQRACGAGRRVVGPRGLGCTVDRWRARVQGVGHVPYAAVLVLLLPVSRWRPAGASNRRTNCLGLECWAGVNCCKGGEHAACPAPAYTAGSWLAGCPVSARGHIMDLRCPCEAKRQDKGATHTGTRLHLLVDVEGRCWLCVITY